MIPQRSLTRGNSGNGVSCRVEACRRRLRTIRVNKWAQLEALKRDVDVANVVADGGPEHSERLPKQAFVVTLEEVEEAGLT